MVLAAKKKKKQNTGSKSVSEVRGSRPAKSIPTWQRMKSKLQLGRVIILCGDVETFLETLNDFHNPFQAFEEP